MTRFHKIDFEKIRTNTYRGHGVTPDGKRFQIRYTLSGPAWDQECTEVMEAVEPGVNAEMASCVAGDSFSLWMDGRAGISV